MERTDPSVPPVSTVALGAARERLLETILRLSFQRGRFQLASGAWSDYYLDLRRSTLDAMGLADAARLLWPAVEEASVDAVGGPTLGADPLVAGLLGESLARGRPIQGFLVRAAAKDHGTGRRIEGHCPAGARVAIIDDVVTRGGSLLRALDAVREAGATPVLALAMVDRGEGGRESLEQESIRLVTIFRIDEVLAAARERGI